MRQPTHPFLPPSSQEKKGILETPEIVFPTYFDQKLVLTDLHVVEKYISIK